MTCAPGRPCEEGIKRRNAFAVLALMAILFVALSLVSFLPSRGQVVPADVSYDGHGAVDGRRVFQAYNCMGCHTIVGNGAYLGPDLTNIYADAGPAWLEAFLPSAGGWPTGPAVLVQLQREGPATASGTTTLEGYFERYPAAAERVRRRGGQPTHMPNLHFREGEVAQLIAFMKYTSQMHNEGWPPKPKVDGLEFPLATPMPGIADAAAAAVAPTARAAPLDSAALGEQVVAEFGCTACHADDTSRRVGPGWGGLYGSTVMLSDGSAVEADEDYIIASILTPDAHVADGYVPGTMPSYEALLDEAQIEAIVAYIRTLSGERQ